MSKQFSVNEEDFQTNDKALSTEPDFDQKFREQMSFDQFLQVPNCISGDSNFNVLKQNFSSINSQNVPTNMTFGVCDKGRQKNLAYAVCQKFPPRIKKQVLAIIEYYENRLQGQKSMFWRTLENSKKQQHELTKKQLTYEIQSLGQKNQIKIKELEQQLAQKSKEMSELNYELQSHKKQLQRVRNQIYSHCKQNDK